MRSFGTLLTEYMKRTGISDSELARSIGVQRQTIFRWKEGSVARPRVREDVLNCAARLRLTPEERDLLLIAAGFPPDNPAHVVPPLPLHPARQSIEPEPIEPLIDPLPDPLIDPLVEQADEATSQLDELPPQMGSVLPSFVSSLSQNETGGQPPRLEMSSNLPTAHPTPGRYTTTPLKPASPVKTLETIQTARQNRASQTYIWWVFAPILVLIGVIAIWQPGFDGWRGVPTPILIATLTPEEVPLHVGSTQIPTPSPTPTVTVSPTPIAIQAIHPAQAEEILIICAEFGHPGEQSYRMASRLSDALSQAIEESELTNVRIELWPRVIEKPVEAERIISETKATLLIWGEYDAGRVVIRYTDAIPGKQQDNELFLASADELPLMINSVTPKEVKATALVALGQIYRKKRPAEAEKALLRAIEQKSTKADLNIRAFFYLGLLQIAKGCDQDAQELAVCDQAIQYFTQAIDLSPIPLKDWWILWYNRGSTYINRSRQVSQTSADFAQNLQAALDDLDYAIQIEPDYYRSFYNRGLAYYWRNQEGDAERTIEELSIALIKKPAYPNSYNLRGLARLRLSKDRGWEQDFKRMLELSSEKSAAYAALCWGYMLYQEIEQARAMCNQIKDNDILVEGQDIVGIVLAQEGKNEEAITAFERYLEWVKNDSGEPYDRKNGPLVEQWITALRAGQNPFDAAMLERLRTQ